MFVWTPSQCQFCEAVLARVSVYNDGGFGTSELKIYTIFTLVKYANSKGSFVLVFILQAELASHQDHHPARHVPPQKWQYYILVQ